MRTYQKYRRSLLIVILASNLSLTSGCQSFFNNDNNDSQDSLDTSHLCKNLRHKENLSKLNTEQTQLKNFELISVWSPEGLLPQSGELALPHIPEPHIPLPHIPEPHIPEEPIIKPSEPDTLPSKLDIPYDSQLLRLRIDVLSQQAEEKQRVQKIIAKIPSDDFSEIRKGIRNDIYNFYNYSYLVYKKEAMLDWTTDQAYDQMAEIYAISQNTAAPIIIAKLQDHQEGITNANKDLDLEDAKKAAEEASKQCLQQLKQQAVLVLSASTTTLIVSAGVASALIRVQSNPDTQDNHN